MSVLSAEVSGCFAQGHFNSNGTVISLPNAWVSTRGLLSPHKNFVMNTFYVAIHFDGYAVTGFIVPECTTPQEALKKLKYQLVQRLRGLKYLERKGYPDTGGQAQRNRSFLRALKRPWRNAEQKTRRDPVVKVYLLKTVVNSNYWLETTSTGEYIVNTNLHFWTAESRTAS